jgi:N-acyl-D-aspartate/D-glutamate deacylase
VPVEIYHLKAAGTNNWPKGPLAIAKIDSARKAGVDVQANMYPYVGRRNRAVGVHSALGVGGWEAHRQPAEPGDAREDQGRDEQRAHGVGEPCLLAGPQNVLVLGLNKPENKQYAGKRLGEIATMMNKPWDDAAMDL